MGEDEPKDSSADSVLRDILSGLKAEGWSTEELADVEREFAIRGDGPWWLPDHFEFRDFMERLKHRQGSIEPDLGALYKRKAELDQESQ